MTTAIVVSLACAGAGFIAELIFYREKAEPKSSEGQPKNLTLHAPITGKYIPLEEIPDKVFSQGFLGQGCGIEPDDNTVYSPVDGEVVQVADTKHAVGIQSSEGVEVLIHVGMDTVDMKGEGFSPKVKVGDKVKIGEPLLVFDPEKIKAAGHPLTTALVITNSDEFSEIAFTAGKNFGKTEEIGRVH